ncbi:glycosyltransferase family 4 protein [Paucibacter sp. APW11]|uniref:Glycosyltransferase family 4 protein n=1 Tax=Roseateles aquae TaxID=3077235 RepID=A0ABU3P5T6_9BURK|nr:glycosyltransferase family 4 protein [Paucibacter sp. APW11]MDT8997940.1 glycosyltransferase family 4 protein [Paucibacter sp. APW11]
MSFAGMRIGLVGPLAPPAGGMALQTAQLADLLRGEGAEVEIVQTNRPYQPAWAGRLPVIRAWFRLLPYLWQLWTVAGRSTVMHMMANSGWSWHLFAAPAIWMARVRGTPLVVNYRGGGAASFLQQSAPSVRATMRRSAGLIVPSGFLKQVFAEHAISASVVPNIINLSRYKPAQQAVPASEPHLIVTRNLEDLYDNASAIRALAIVRERHPQARLTLAGTGPELARLQALAGELGLADVVRFAGRLEREAMAGLYQSASVMLNPSLTDNMPNSVLEALASGVPVVSTDVGGVPYLLEHERTGLLVKPAQPAELAAAVLRVLDDAALRQRLVEQGLAEVERYTWARVAPLLLQSYQQACNGSSTRSGLKSA